MRHRLSHSRPIMACFATVKPTHVRSNSFTANNSNATDGPGTPTDRKMSTGERPIRNNIDAGGAGGGGGGGAGGAGAGSSAGSGGGGGGGGGGSDSKLSKSPGGFDIGDDAREAMYSLSPLQAQIAYMRVQDPNDSDGSGNSGSPQRVPRYSVTPNQARLAGVHHARPAAPSASAAASASASASSALLRGPSRRKVGPGRRLSNGNKNNGPLSLEVYVLDADAPDEQRLWCVGGVARAVGLW